MFGYASNETDVLMPRLLLMRIDLVQRQAQLRKEDILPWLRPDAKSKLLSAMSMANP